MGEQYFSSDRLNSYCMWTIDPTDDPISSLTLQSSSGMLWWVM